MAEHLLGLSGGHSTLAQAAEKKTGMEYQLEIYGLRGRDEANCMKTFSSTAPFLPFHVGDLLDASNWAHKGYQVLRVLSVEHSISEKSGIDPSGGIVRRVLINTEGVLGSVRDQSPAASSPKTSRWDV